jgi:carboxyl-terminal processing protease
MKATLILAMIVAGLAIGCIARDEAEMCTPPDRVVGIGMQLGIEEHQVVIANVMPEKPAARAGLAPGLVVRKIDGTPTTGSDLARWVEMVRGEAGTKVVIEVFDPAAGSTRTVEIVRERVL